MRRIGSFVLASATMLAGCRNSYTCPQISTATRVVVTQGSDQNRVFIDPAQLKSLIAFANARRESSKPLDTMPAPEVTAAFYNNSGFVCALGAGSNFFFVACPSWRGVRTASNSELSEFKRLIGETH